MSRKVVSTILSVAFLLFTAMPTILVIVDDTIDTSVVFSISEEEEKVNDKDLDIEVLLSVIETDDYRLDLTFIENDLGYFYKNYPKPHLNKIFPPPKLYI